jgi:fructose-1,6-bisphosphatase/inositol monophosphatase family enzyme
MFLQFTASIETRYKDGDDPVTIADRPVNEALRHTLLRDEEDWLSEESLHDATQLTKSRVWVIDPIDGTREFVEGIPEFCISVGLVEDGQLIAGGIATLRRKRSSWGRPRSYTLYAETGAGETIPFTPTHLAPAS